jgi:hypothetical protein
LFGLEVLECDGFVEVCLEQFGSAFLQTIEVLFGGASHVRGRVDSLFERATEWLRDVYPVRRGRLTGRTSAQCGIVV